MAGHGELMRSVCLVVADFADQNLVGSWRRIERSQRANVSPFSRSQGLRDAANLVFDRVFDGDDLVFVVLISLSAA